MLWRGIMWACVVLPALIAAPVQAQDHSAKPPVGVVKQEGSDPNTHGQNGETDSNSALGPEPPLVKVTIATSRPEVTGNDVYGLSADLQNISSTPLTLSARDLLIVLQPEVAGDTHRIPSFPSIFPTEQGDDARITIQRNEHYSAVWDVSKQPPGTCTPPGNSGYFVAALRKGGELDQFKVQPSHDTATRLKRALIVTRSLVSAALVIAVVTVVLSRISDTQFPIKVSVNDFGGALTVGFIAYFVGNNLIDQIVGWANKKKSADTG